MESFSKLNKAYMGITRGAVHTLLILFVLGMIANLYVEIPQGLVNQAAWQYVFTSAPWIAAHAIIGTLLLLVSVASMVLAVVSHKAGWMVGSLVGLLFTLMAAFFGSEFVSNGGSNLSSLLMAFGFLGALVSYALVTQPKPAKM